MSSNLEDGSSSILGSHSNHVIPIRQLRERHRVKRRNSETSTDSREESYMESDNEGQGLVSLEEPVNVHLCNSSRKPFDTKVLHTHS